MKKLITLLKALKKHLTLINNEAKQEWKDYLANLKQNNQRQETKWRSKHEV